MFANALITFRSSEYLSRIFEHGSRTIIVQALEIQSEITREAGSFSSEFARKFICKNKNALNSTI